MKLIVALALCVTLCAVSADAQVRWIWDLIYPGTRWCGDGNIANGYDDLGILKYTDMCCRDHDYCDDNIVTGETKHGLTNNGKFTRSHCKCDNAFFRCLEASRDIISSSAVGLTYFTVLGGSCYDFKHPATCSKTSYLRCRGGKIKARCIEYSYDESQPKTWQWFDVPRWFTGDVIDCY